MPCHDMKDNEGLYRFIPDSKKNHNNSRLSSFLNILFYWNKNLSYV